MCVNFRLLDILQEIEPRLTDDPAVNFCRLTSTGSRLGELLGEQSDETLAALISRCDARGLHRCSKAVIEELLYFHTSEKSARCAKELPCWFRSWNAAADDLEDLVCTVHVNVMQNRLIRYDSNRPFRPFLRRIAFRVFLDDRQAAMRRPRQMGDGWDEPVLDQRDEEVVARELMQRVVAALQEWPDRWERMIFRLNFVEELTPQRSPNSWVWGRRTCHLG